VLWFVCPNAGAKHPALDGQCSSSDGGRPYCDDMDPHYTFVSELDGESASTYGGCYFHVRLSSRDSLALNVLASFQIRSNTHSEAQRGYRHAVSCVNLLLSAYFLTKPTLTQDHHIPTADPRGHLHHPQIHALHSSNLQ
jgi:hypothetical protein